MFQNAVEVENVENMLPEKRPFHFDLVGLA
jgi:hypothetical protein